MRNSLDNVACWLVVDKSFYKTYATAIFEMVLIHGGPNLLRRHESQKEHNNLFEVSIADCSCRSY